MVFFQEKNQAIMNVFVAGKFQYLLLTHVLIDKSNSACIKCSPPLGLHVFFVLQRRTKVDDLLLSGVKWLLIQQYLRRSHTEDFPVMLQEKQISADVSKLRASQKKIWLHKYSPLNG